MHNFVSAAFAAAKGLKDHPCVGHVLADGTASVAIQGYVHEQVQIQSLSEDVKMYVIDLPGQAMQADLGQYWLLKHRAVVSYIDKWVMYFQGSQWLKLKVVADAPPLPPLLASPPLLPCMQLKAMTQEKGYKVFLVHVSAVDEQPKEGELPPEIASVSVDVLQAAKQIVYENMDVFAEMPPGLPPDRRVCHTIDIGDAKPVARPAYRLSLK